jgi:hypothetical protein
MRKISLPCFLLLVSCVVSGQLGTSANLACTIVSKGGMACNGISSPPRLPLPNVQVTHFIVEPGGVLDGSAASGDRLIIGIDGGDLLNEKEPFLHVFLEKDYVTLMPKEKSFRLRNTTARNVEFRLIEIQRQSSVQNRSTDEPVN